MKQFKIYFIFISKIIIIVKSDWVEIPQFSDATPKLLDLELKQDNANQDDKMLNVETNFPGEKMWNNGEDKKTINVETSFPGESGITKIERLHEFQDKYEEIPIEEEMAIEDAKIALKQFTTTSEEKIPGNTINLHKETKKIINTLKQQEQIEKTVLGLNLNPNEENTLIKNAKIKKQDEAFEEEASTETTSTSRNKIGTRKQQQRRQQNPLNKNNSNKRMSSSVTPLVNNKNANSHTRTINKNSTQSNRRIGKLPVAKKNTVKDTNPDMNGHSYVGGVMPLFKSIQSYLIRNSHRHFGGKIEFLRNLRDNLVGALQEKMIDIWGVKNSNTGRSAREYKDEHQHVDLGSNEGALMTIGFLTFAVALIKLILQLFHVHKSKYMTTTTMAPAAAAALLGLGRKKRSLEDEERFKILGILEDFKLNEKFH